MITFPEIFLFLTAEPTWIGSVVFLSRWSLLPSGAQNSLLREASVMSGKSKSRRDDWLLFPALVGLYMFEIKVSHSFDGTRLLPNPKNKQNKQTNRTATSLLISRYFATCCGFLRL